MSQSRQLDTSYSNSLRTERNIYIYIYTYIHTHVYMYSYKTCLLVIGEYEASLVNIESSIRFPKITFNSTNKTVFISQTAQFGF